MLFYKLRLNFYNFLYSLNSHSKNDLGKMNIMFKFSELELMFYDPLDWIVNSSNRYLFNKKFIKVIFS